MLTTAHILGYDQSMAISKSKTGQLLTMILLLVATFFVFQKIAYAMKIIDISDGKMHSTDDDQNNYSSGYNKGYNAYNGGGDDYTRGVIDGFKRRHRQKWSD